MVEFRSFAIVPAAGRSQRMGQPKLLLPLGDRTVIEHVLAAWRASRVTETIVVVHPEDNALAEVCRAGGATVVVPETPPPDMKASILAGLDFVETAWQPRSQDAWLVAPADLPALSPATTDALLEAFDGNPSTVLAPVHAGRRGHPLLFPWALAPEVRKLEPAGTLRDLLHSHAIHEVACGLRDENDDLDSPADYRRWQDRYKRI